ncbi:MAG TPA: hypothetical protein PKM55_07715 [Acidobacteriota bacterium]|nr:hypothetical protein [Acidobacteriota bacterium]
MAVYKHNYQPYEGPLTPPRFRCLVLTRYAMAGLFRSRLFFAFFILCFAAPAVGAILIYLHYNTLGLQMIGQTIRDLLPINADFFLYFLAIQTGLGMFLTAIVGPGLIAPDLSNNALPLILARPFSRTEYILGKLTVLVGFLSLLTWIPLLALFIFQCTMAGAGWLFANVRIAVAIWFGSWAWILVLALLALAFSAWVKWRPVAGFLILGFFLISAGVAEAFNEMLSTQWGVVLNPAELLKIVWDALFLAETDAVIPPFWAGAIILAQCAGFLFLLYRRVRAYEVVR